MSKSKPSMRGISSRKTHEPPALDLLATAPAPLRLVLPEHDAVNLVLVGCGGTGSHLASGLGALACELRERRGTNVSLLFVDPDRVEPKNVGRQLFAPADVGKYKAHVLAQRITAAYRIPIDAFAESITQARLNHAPFHALNLVVGAVDNHAARRVIHSAVANANGRIWWLDCGNENHSGQVVLGNATSANQFKRAVELGMLDRAPALSLVHPEFLKPEQKRRRVESCAELTAAGEQGLMVNRLVAAWALSLLNDFLITRDLTYFGLTFNARTGGTRAYSLDLPTLAQVTGVRCEQLKGKGK